MAFLGHCSEDHPLRAWSTHKHVSMRHARTHRPTDRPTDQPTDKHTHTYTHTHKHTHTHTALCYNWPLHTYSALKSSPQLLPRTFWQTPAGHCTRVRSVESFFVSGKHTLSITFTTHQTVAQTHKRLTQHFYTHSALAHTFTASLKVLP